MQPTPDRKPSDLPVQSFSRLAEHPATHHVQHVAVFANKRGQAVLSCPAKLNGGHYPTIREARAWMRA